MQYFIPAGTNVQRIWWKSHIAGELWQSWGESNIMTNQDFVFPPIQVAGSRDAQEGMRLFENIRKYNMPTITIEINEEYRIDVDPQDIVKL